jgi:hypothetical protein
MDYASELKACADVTNPALREAELWRLLHIARDAAHDWRYSYAKAMGFSVKEFECRWAFPWEA